MLKISCAGCLGYSQPFRRNSLIKCVPQLEIANYSLKFITLMLQGRSKSLMLIPLEARHSACYWAAHSEDFVILACSVLRAKAATALARLSHPNSVRLSVTRVDQSKTVQARITRSSPAAAWKTLVSGLVKLFYKFVWDHPERGR